jgi:hypothetical protein
MLQLNLNDIEELAPTIADKNKTTKLSIFVEFGLNLTPTDKQISAVFSRFDRNKVKAFRLIESSFCHQNEERLSVVEERHVRLMMGCNYVQQTIYKAITTQPPQSQYPLFNPRLMLSHLVNFF